MEPLEVLSIYLGFVWSEVKSVADRCMDSSYQKKNQLFFTSCKVLLQHVSAYV
jgi:hypothetical protein